MRPSPQPHPLNPRQRLGLRGARAAFRLMAPVARVRRARAALGRVTRHRYGTLAAETVEVLHPRPGAPEQPPVVYVHGGGWIFGNKELYTADLAFLVERGHRVYNVDYPLAPEHPFPAALRSLAAALCWVADHHGRGDALHLMGDSAGGNLVMMLGLLCAEPKAFEALDPALADSRLPAARSVVSLYGVLDRTSWLAHRFPAARLMLHCYGGPAAFEPEVGPELALTPLDRPTTRRPPCLLAIGTDDPLAESSRLAHARLRSDDPRVTLIEYPGEGHGFFNAPWRPASRKLRADIVRFLDEV